MKIGFWELIVIVIVAFVFIGPDQLRYIYRKFKTISSKTISNCALL